MDKAAFQNIQKKLGLTNEGISEALDVELFTVQMWACGTWLVPRSIAKFLRTLLSMKRNEEVLTGDHSDIYMAGWNRGHKKGCLEGNIEGSFQGHVVGHKSGYRDGYHNGYEAAIKEGYMAAKAAVGLD